MPAKAGIQCWKASIFLSKLHLDRGSRRGDGTSFRSYDKLTTWLLLLSLLLLPLAANAVGPRADRRQLANGARLVVSEQHNLPMVIVQIFLDAGSRRDPAGKEGLASFTADLLTEGTRQRSAAQISEVTDFIGASLSTSADLDYASASVTVLRKDLDTGLDLLTDVLLRPSFPEAEVTRRREATLAALTAEEDQPGRVAARAFAQTLFRGEAYGHPAVGSIAAVRSFKRGDVVSFFEQHYRANTSIITVVGDVDANDIEARLNQALANWRSGATAGEYGQQQPVTNPAPVLIDKPLTQTNIILGHRGVARDNPDYYALNVMNFILGGGGFTSRLLDNIRTKAGLAYSVGSSFSANLLPGSFQVVLQTKNASAADAIQRACSELSRIRTEPVSDEELQGAKLYLTGSFPLRFDSNAKVAGFLGQVELFHLGSDYAERYAERINAITKEEILRVAQQYLHPEQLLLVVVGNLGEAKIGNASPCVTAVGAE